MEVDLKEKWTVTIQKYVADHFNEIVGRLPYNEVRAKAIENIETGTALFGSEITRAALELWKIANKPTNVLKHTITYDELGHIIGTTYETGTEVSFLMLDEEVLANPVEAMFALANDYTDTLIRDQIYLQLLSTVKSWNLESYAP